MIFKWKWIRLLGIVLAWLPLAVLADDYQLKSLRIVQPFTRATPPGARAAGVFFVVDNTGAKPDALIGVASPAAASAELHQMTMDGSVMKMRAMTAIDVPARGRLELKPGSYHVMLVDLVQPIKVGDKVPLKLTFRDAGSIDIVLHVQTMGAMTHGQ
ncbi:MAG: copper chaperone PCu(A)C [Betaproteobacteria bacterium]